MYFANNCFMYTDDCGPVLVVDYEDVEFFRGFPVWPHAREILCALFKDDCDEFVRLVKHEQGSLRKEGYAIAPSLMLSFTIYERALRCAEAILSGTTDQLIDVNVAASDMEIPPIHIAVTCFLPDFVDLLLKYGARLDVRCKNFRTQYYYMQPLDAGLEALRTRINIQWTPDQSVYGLISALCGSPELEEDFPNSIGLHQGSALSPYLFTIIIDELTKHMQKEIPECMLFADDIVLMDDTREGINVKLEAWRVALESKAFKISRNKTEYMECHFSNNKNNNTSIKIGDHVLENSKSFKYLGSILQENGGIDQDVTHRIQVGWTKWRNASSILCDRKILLKLKGKFYKTSIRPAMLYELECWGINYEHEKKMRITEMKMLK